MSSAERRGQHEVGGDMVAKIALPLDVRRGCRPVERRNHESETSSGELHNKLKTVVVKTSKSREITRVLVVVLGEKQSMCVGISTSSHASSSPSLTLLPLSILPRNSIQFSLFKYEFMKPQLMVQLPRDVLKLFIRDLSNISQSSTSGCGSAMSF